jgi:hypothetical protein
MLSCARHTTFPLLGRRRHGFHLAVRENDKSPFRPTFR